MNRKNIMLTLSTAFLLAAVSGSPQPTVPGDAPTAWIETTNDSFMSMGHDDALTASFGAGAELGNWRIGAGYEILTHDAAGARCDELTLSVSYAWRFPGFTYSAGVGTRFSGDLGGEWVQNEWHRWNGDARVYGDYDAPDWRPVVLCDARWSLRLHEDWEIEVLGSGLGSYDFVDVEISPRVVFGRYGRFCIGPYWAEHFGEYLSPTAEFAADQRYGLGVALGVQMDAFQIRWVSIIGGGMFGSIGFQF